MSTPGLWTADKTRLMKFREKIPPVHAKAFSGDINKTNLPEMIQELHVQLQAYNILELAEFPGAVLPSLQGAASTDAPPAPVGAEPADHRLARLAAFIGAQFMILLSLVSGTARDFVIPFSHLPSFSTEPAKETIVNKLRAKFVPSSYPMLVQAKITKFTAPPSLRPSAALDVLVKLNLHLEKGARFTDGQLRTFFSNALDHQIQDALVLVTEQNLDAYAAQADLVFDRPTFTPSKAAFPVMAMQHGHAQNEHYNQSPQGRSTHNPFQQRTSPGRHNSDAFYMGRPRTPTGGTSDNGVCYNCWRDTWATGELDHVSSNCPNPRVPRPADFWKERNNDVRNKLAELATLKRSATSSSFSGSDSRRQRVNSPASVGFKSQTDLAERVAALEMQLNRDSADSSDDLNLNDQSASAH